MSILITYDISSKHTEVKAELLKMGFEDFWFDDKKQKNFLPNTTLLGEGTPENAIDALQNAINLVNSKMPLLPKTTVNSAVAVNWDKGCAVDNRPDFFKLLKRK